MLMQGGWWRDISTGWWDWEGLRNRFRRDRLQLPAFYASSSLHSREQGTMWDRFRNVVNLQCFSILLLCRPISLEPPCLRLGIYSSTKLHNYVSTPEPSTLSCLFISTQSLYFGYGRERFQVLENLQSPLCTGKDHHSLLVRNLDKSDAAHYNPMGVLRNPPDSSP